MVSCSSALYPALTGADDNSRPTGGAAGRGAYCGSALLSLAEAFGGDIGQGRILIRQKVSQSDLAAMAGIARENVSRVLGFFPLLNAGELAIVYCFVFLYLAVAGGGVWSLDHLRAGNKASWAR